MKNNIIFLLLLLIFILIIFRKKYDLKEDFILKKCIDINNYSGENNKTCENEIKNTQETMPVLKYYNYDKYCLINNYKNFLEPKIIGNYKISLKCDPQLKCACDDSPECMYIKSPCTNNFNQNLSHKKFYGYDLIYKKK